MSTDLKLFEPKNMDELIRLSDILSKTSFVPNYLQGNPGGVLACILTGKELGMSTMFSLRNICLINGKASIYGDAMIALVYASGELAEINETFDSQTMTAKCHVVRKDGIVFDCTFSEKDAVLAQLIPGKNNSAWLRYPARMLAMRARGFCLRDAFAHVLNGLITTEELNDYPKDEYHPKNYYPKNGEFSEAEIELKNENTGDAIISCTTIEQLIDIHKSLSDADRELYKEKLTAKKEEIYGH